ncbi:MAG: hypothetical protein ACC641_09045 [Acidiferrobacterales bacterium]
MTACSHTSDCELFPMISVNSALKIWRAFYCEGKWHECARYKLSLKGKVVPPNLLPNGKSIDLAIGQSQIATKPAPVAAPASAKVATPGKSALDKIDQDIGAINPDKPVAAASPVQITPSPAPVEASSTGTMSFYLRMQIQSGAGVMTEIIRSLGQNRVRIDAVTEKKGVSEGEPSYLVVLTDQVDDATLDKAIVGLQNLKSVRGEIKRIALEKLVKGQLV